MSTLALKSVLLVDDDPSTNFFNQFVISRSGISEIVEYVESGFAALDKIQEDFKNGLIPKDKNAILLDLNMPRMNGWEFLQEFSSLAEEIKNRFNIFILSTSSNPTEMQMAREHPLVQDYFVKPLSEKQINDLISKLVLTV